MSTYDLIVIGGGPAGILAAGRAAEKGAKVLLLEKMREPGRKLKITGKGRCNITNSAPAGEFLKHVYPNAKFLRNAFSAFYNTDIIALLEKYGLEVQLERGGRYFPKDNDAPAVLAALLRWIKSLPVEIKCGYRAEKILTEDKQVTAVKANGEIFSSAKVIIATGGKSYSATGSTGDGYELARKLGHTINPPLPALVPLVTEGNMAQRLMGLNLRNVNAVVWVDGKKAGEAFGEMIFTHFGLSGPIILTLSRIAVAALHQNKNVEISIDLKPALDDQKLDKRLLRDLNEHGKKRLVNIFKLWLPSSMIPVFLSELQLEPDKECHQVSGKERKQIRNMMKNLRFKVNHHRSFKEAIITAGGIPTSEIKAKTMESKLIGGLYFAGEVIDLDAETGGYNLQIAYSTGWLAGDSAVKPTNP